VVAIVLRIQEAFIGGIALGLSGLFIRVVTTGIPLDALFITAFLSNPFSFFALMLGAYGFIHFQIALYKGKISLVIPIVSALSVVTPVILATIFLAEYVPAIRWLGILLILIGTIGISEQKHDESPLRTIMNSLKK
jgi:drug/metabolite transporter (DMT)-like permease